MDGAGIPAALADPDFPRSALDLVADAVARLLGVGDRRT